MSELFSPQGLGRKIGLGVFLLLVGFVAGRLSSTDRPDPSSPPMASVSPSSHAQVLQTEDGAVLSATIYAQTLVGPSDDEADYVVRVLAIATPEWKARARTLAENSIDFVQERYGRDGRITFQPLRYRLKSFTSAKATVDVWGVVLGSGSLRRGIEESWVTGTIRMRWVDIEGWKVTGQSSKAGPTPETLVAEGESIPPSLIINGFRGYSGVPEP